MKTLSLILMVCLSLGVPTGLVYIIMKENTPRQEPFKVSFYFRNDGTGTIKYTVKNLSLEKFLRSRGSKKYREAIIMPSKLAKRRITFTYQANAAEMSGYIYNQYMHFWGVSITETKNEDGKIVIIINPGPGIGFK